MPSDFSRSASHESGVFQSVLLVQQASTNTCTVSTKCAVAVSSASSVVVCSTPSVTIGSTLSASSSEPRTCVNVRVSPFLPADGESHEESVRSLVPDPVSYKDDVIASKEPNCRHSHQILKDFLFGYSGRYSPEDSPSKENDLLVISESTEPRPRTVCDLNREEKVLVIGGDLLISQAEASRTDQHSDTKTEHSDKSLIPLTHADSSLIIQKIDYKCKVLQEHSKACVCSTPRLHVYLTGGHQCSGACDSNNNSSSLFKTYSRCTKPSDKPLRPSRTPGSAVRMTGKLKARYRGRKANSFRFSDKLVKIDATKDDPSVSRKPSVAKKRNLVVSDKDEPESELLAEGECVWLPTIMSTLSGDVEYVVLDDDALNLGKTTDRSTSPESLKSKIDTIYDDIDEKPIITISNGASQNTKQASKSRPPQLRRLSEVHQDPGHGGNSASGTEGKGTEEKCGDDPAASSSLAEVCTNHCPSIKDIFGDISVKEEPVEDVKQDMTVDDFSKEMLKNSRKESSDHPPSTIVQKVDTGDEDEYREEGSSRGLFAKLIKEENNASEEDNMDGHNSDDSLGPLHIDEKYLPSPEDAGLSLVKDVVELNMPSVNIISPFKIKILLGSPNRESHHQVQAEPPSPSQVGSSSTAIFGKVVEVKNVVTAQKKVKRAPSTPIALNVLDNIQSLTCIYCHTSCPNAQALAEHFENHQKDGLIICYFCQKSFGDKTGMKRHMRTHTGEKPYQCKICGKRFSLPGNFKKHRDIHEDKRTEPCGVCGKTFRRKEHLKYHMRTHTGEKPFRCNECGTCFTARYSLQIHMNIHLGKKPYKCTYCSKAFSDKSTMRKHVRVHTGEKPFRCQECWRCFGESGTLAAHMATHRNDRPYCCDKCDLRFKTTGGLRQHEKVHSGEKQFACRFCSMRFLQKYNMTMHERIHTGEKPYTCSHCDRSFRSRSCLAKHVVLHGGDDERRFGCEHCNSRFYRKAHLRRHIDMHLGIKNYECDYCHKKFCTRGTLRSHTKTFHSHGARRFPCSRCGRVFKRQVYVSTHLCANTAAVKNEKRDEDEAVMEAVHETIFANESTDSEDFTFEVKSEPEDAVVDEDRMNDEMEDSEVDYAILEKEVQLEWEPRD